MRMPSGTTTFLSTMQRFNSARRPSTTLSMMMLSVTLQCELTRMSRPRIERSTRPPEMIEPLPTMLSSIDARHGAVLGVAVHRLAGRQRRLPRPERPLAVIQVEARPAADQIHGRLVVAVQRPDVAPVARLLRGPRPGTGRRRPAPFSTICRNDVLAEVVAGCPTCRASRLSSRTRPLGIEEVDAHVHQAMIRIAREWCVGCRASPRSRPPSSCRPPRGCRTRAPPPAARPRRRGSSPPGVVLVELHQVRRSPSCRCDRPRG